MINFSLLCKYLNRFIIINVYEVYNLLILHPVLQKTFHYSVEGEYLTISSNSNYATLPSQYDMLTSSFLQYKTLTLNCKIVKMKFLLSTLLFLILPEK